MPKEMAHSHLGMATDGRYVYVVTGQYGPQCRGPTARCFVLDTETKKWHDLPSLPAPRYFLCGNRFGYTSSMLHHLMIKGAIFVQVNIYYLKKLFSFIVFLSCLLKDFFS